MTTNSNTKSRITRFATVLTTLTFLGVGISGLAMTFHIGGHALNGIHTVTGVAFVVASILHLTRNWRAMLKLLARRSTQIILAVGVLVFALLVAFSPMPPHRGPPAAPNTTTLVQPDPADH